MIDLFDTERILADKIRLFSQNFLFSLVIAPKLNHNRIFSGSNFPNPTNPPTQYDRYGQNSHDSYNQRYNPQPNFGNNYPNNNANSNNVNNNYNNNNYNNNNNNNFNRNGNTPDNVYRPFPSK